MSEESKRKSYFLEFTDALGAEYKCDLLNDKLLDQLGLRVNDVKEVRLDFQKMHDYFYAEEIPSFGYTTVAGGSLGLDLITYAKGVFQVQPFLRYDKGHKQGLKTEHLNPKLRVIKNSKEWYLPDKGGINIFQGLPHVLEVAYPIHWKAYDPDDLDNAIEGEIRHKFKKRPSSDSER